MAVQTARKVYIEGPSLLAADSEEEPSSDEGSDVEDNRPSLLPLDEVIRAVPNSLSSLLEVVVPRLQQRSGVKGVSPEDQQSFVSILVGELSSKFSDIKQQIDDPFLSPQKNRTLHRLTVVQVCRILEDLYAQYTAKASRLCEDGPLSIAAHMSRLRAQLAVQASKSISLPAIRRQLLSQLRGPLTTSHPSRLPPVPRWQPPHRARDTVNLDNLDLGAPLSTKLSSLGLGASSGVLRRRVQRLRAGMTQHVTRDGLAVEVTAASDSEHDVSDVEEHSVTAEASPELLQRPPSMPELYGNFLLCDWKLLGRSPYHVASSDDHRRERRHQALHTARRSSIGSNIDNDFKWTAEESKVEKKLGDYTREDFNSDLHRLSEHEPAFIHSVSQDEIDPLLQACVHGLSKRQRSRLQAHDLQLRRQAEEERRREEEERQREREMHAVPTLEDIENMQYLRTQAPQSLSQSHASLHMRSNASDWQTHSQAPSSQALGGSGSLDKSVPDIHREVSHWSEGGVETPSQINSAISDTAISDAPIHSGAAMPGTVGYDAAMLGASSEQDKADSLHLDSGLIPDTVSLHSSAHSRSERNLSPDSVSQHSSIHSRGSLIPDPVSKYSSLQDLGSGGFSPIPATQYDSSRSMTDTHQQQQLHSNYSCHTSRMSSNTPSTEKSRAGHTLGGSGSLLVPVSGLLREEDGDDDSQQQVGRGGWSEGGDGGSTADASGSVKSLDGVGQSDGKSFSQTTFSNLGSHEEREASPDQEPEELGPQPQPAVITTTINGKVIRSSDLCVSERTPLHTLRLKPYKPIWNELTGELNCKTMDDLDSNLTEGREMDLLYHELVRTIPKDYLNFESEPSLIPAIREPVDLPSVLASSSLPHRPSRRVANPDLRPMSELGPPWGDRGKREQWKRSNQYSGPNPKELMAPKGSTLTPAQARQRQQYQNWLKWWRATVSPEDYLKFVAQKESDYLHHVYHLYDSEGSESEAEEEKERRERLHRLHSKLQAKRAKYAEHYRRKNRYEQGMWNVNTVMMGGLGGDPRSSGSSSEEDIEDQLRQLERNGKEPEEGIQQRLQAVWSQLQVPEQQSMEMAIKYSSHQYTQHTRKAITLWESVCSVIEEREGKLEELRTFEKSASDPSRLFAKGHDGSLLQEAKTRRKIHSALDTLDRKLCQILRKLQSRFGDVVTYKGHPYHDKMQHDRTDLLYHLQQDRRQALLVAPPATDKTVRVTVATLNI